MPSKKQYDSRATQSARFRSGAQKLIDAGQLSLSDSNDASQRILAGDALGSSRADQS